MAKKSFWQRGEDYAKKVSDELIDQIKRGVAPWQKPWKPGEQISAENFSTGKRLHRRQQPLPDEPRYPRWTRRQPMGNLQPDSGSGRDRSARARKGRRSCSSQIATRGPRRTRNGQTMKNKEGKNDLRRTKARDAHL